MTADARFKQISNGTITMEEYWRRHNAGQLPNQRVVRRKREGLASSRTEVRVHVASTGSTVAVHRD